MSIRSHYIDAHQAARVAQALQEAGYVVSPEQCSGYVANIANKVDPHNAPRVQRIIEQVATSAHTDSEGFRGWAPPATIQ